MPAILYIVGDDRTVTSTQPDMTGKVLVPVSLPDNAPLDFLVQQVRALTDGLQFSSDFRTALVIKVTLGA